MRAGKVLPDGTYHQDWRDRNDVQPPATGRLGRSELALVPPGGAEMALAAGPGRYHRA